MKGQFTLILVVGLYLSGAGLCVADGQVFRWMDEEGQIIYSDQLPPAYARTERVLISEEGRVVTVVGAPVLVSDQNPVAPDSDLNAPQEDRPVTKAVHWRERDRALVKTYTDVEDIRFARDSRLAQLDSRIETFRSKAMDSQIRIDVLEGYAASGSYENLPQNYERELESLKRDLKIILDQVALETKSRDETQAQFEADIARYTVLKGDTVK